MKKLSGLLLVSVCFNFSCTQSDTEQKFRGNVNQGESSTKIASDLNGINFSQSQWKELRKQPISNLREWFSQDVSDEAIFIDGQAVRNQKTNLELLGPVFDQWELNHGTIGEMFDELGIKRETSLSARDVKSTLDLYQRFDKEGDFAKLKDILAKGRSHNDYYEEEMDFNLQQNRKLKLADCRDIAKAAAGTTAATAVASSAAPPGAVDGVGTTYAAFSTAGKCITAGIERAAEWYAGAIVTEAATDGAGTPIAVGEVLAGTANIVSAGQCAWSLITSAAVTATAATYVAGAATYDGCNPEN